MRSNIFSYHFPLNFNEQKSVSKGLLKSMSNNFFFNNSLQIRLRIFLFSLFNFHSLLAASGENSCTCQGCMGKRSGSFDFDLKPKRSHDWWKRRTNRWLRFYLVEMQKLSSTKGLTIYSELRSPIQLIYFKHWYWFFFFSIKSLTIIIIIFIYLLIVNEDIKLVWWLRGG